jgi:AraC-like DNA-binding protein/NADH:ubiquinone oxidoreductase subunit 6 (subunit J)
MLHGFSPWGLVQSLVQMIIYAGIIQGFFLALILTTKKNKKRKSNRILAILLVVISVSILHSVIAYGIFSTHYRIREPLILLIGPLLLFYIREFTGAKSNPVKDILHFTPFILFFIIILPEWLQGESFAYANFLRQNSVVISIVTWALIVVQYAYYWLKSVRMIFTHKMTVESEFSNIEGKTLSWLGKFLHIFGILLILFAGTVIFAIHSSQYSAVDSIVSLGLSCVVFILGYEGLFQEEIFSTIYKPGNDKEVKSKELLKSAEISNEEEILSQKLIAFVEEKKPYLDEELTLTKLAEQLGINRNQLSSVINNKFGCNFYTFINKYRVEEVKQLLVEPKNKAFTILSLAYQAGFPSKSSFQDIFKKLTGMTPSEYQNKSNQLI